YTHPCRTLWPRAEGRCKKPNTGSRAMPLFGAHMSVAGGCHNALIAAQEHGFDTVQIFTKNNNQWNAKDFTPDDLKLFRDTLKAAKLKYPTAHDSYLINLASPDPVL